MNEYFRTNGISKYGNGKMVVKTIVMLLVFFLPLIILNTGIVTSVFWLFTLYIISGLGMAGVGMGVMHDANHGSYSKNRKVNELMGYTMNLIGANAKIWKLQHNVLHHTYTNISESDEDIKGPFFLRFSPNNKHHWIHRFQFLYAWFFYGLTTIFWATTKDFSSLMRYKKMGLVKSEKVNKELLEIALWKLIYFSYSLILPMILLPISPWLVLLAFLVMHFITGLLLTIVFQAAHVVSSTDFPLPDENGQMENSWTIHQLLTTSNFSPKSRFMSWMIGGLNYQIEHHLFPNICHIHYKKISVIVRETAREYGIPYLSKKTFVSAVWDHLRMLYQLGRTKTVIA